MAKKKGGDASSHTTPKTPTPVTTPKPVYKVTVGGGDKSGIKKSQVTAFSKKSWVWVTLGVLVLIYLFLPSKSSDPRIRALEEELERVRIERQIAEEMTRPSEIEELKAELRALAARKSGSTPTGLLAPSSGYDTPSTPAPSGPNVRPVGAVSKETVHLMDHQSYGRGTHRTPEFALKQGEWSESFVIACPWRGVSKYEIRVAPVGHLIQFENEGGIPKGSPIEVTPQNVENLDIFRGKPNEDNTVRFRLKAKQPGQKVSFILTFP